MNLGRCSKEGTNSAPDITSGMEQETGSPSCREQVGAFERFSVWAEIIGKVHVRQDSGQPAPDGSESGKERGGEDDDPSDCYPRHRSWATRVFPSGNHLTRPRHR